MKCKYCNSEMRLDDVDYNFKGNKDNYWKCDNCNASAFEKLQEKYNHIEINVNYLDLRKYQINVKIKIENQEYKKEIIHYKKDVNIGTICNQIDNFILGLYRKECKYYD